MKKIIVCCCTLFTIFSGIAKAQEHRVWEDENIAAEIRAEALIKEMTLEEKVSQIMNDAPAIDRLGIPKHNWWNECLHGVARAGLATVYPQAIGLAATFDDEALLLSASIIADEARAKHHESVRKGERDIYQGLTFWTPNINIFRDPRWGRGQETYGEDPYLTGRMGSAFVKGLQGDSEKYYKVIATAKHYAVHSGPERGRHTFDVSVSDYDLWDTYLPAFEILVKDVQVASVMCAYNRYNGKPCCGSDELQMDILRNQWKFKGYIVSDCGAIDDFYKTHKVSADAKYASAQAMKAGTDLECGNSYSALIEAVRDEMISEQEIDISLKRLLVARIKLGMYASKRQNIYANIAYDIVDSEEHRLDAKRMAQKSIVLLKNDNGVLPLSKSLKKIAIIGPGANDSISLLGNYNGRPGKIETILQGIKEKCNNTEIVYKKAINLLDRDMIDPVDLWSMFRSEEKIGLKAEYFDNIKLEGLPILTRVENSLNFRGEVKDEIAPGVKAHWVSARWSGTFIPSSTTDYTFSVSGDDGFRLMINGQKVIDHFSYHEEMTDIYTFGAEQGKEYSICLEYFQGDQGASIRLEGGILNRTDYAKVAQSVSDADAIIFVGGISPTVEGEEMPIDLPGFFRGDRTTIKLPEVQSNMIKALAETNKPVIFIMQTGSALAINTEQKYLAAVVNAWYGGQAIGSAVADVLFGDYNPAGRLPITFYKTDHDLPPFEDYSMEERTYRYFTKEPLYPFGFGLSYSDYKYAEMKIEKQHDASLEVSVLVKNVGNYDGDEVVQLYISHKNTQQKAPICALKNFQRVFLKKGESTKVKFTLLPNDLALINTQGHLKPSKGDLSIFIGGGQPNFYKKGVSLMLKNKEIPITAEYSH